jgi:hypothetical protein
MKLIIALLLVFAAQVFAESNDSQEALKKAQTEVRLKLEQFAKDNADYEPLLSAQKLSASLNPRGDKTHLTKLDEECLRLQLKVLLALANARDPHYDRDAPENIVYMNLAPPLTKGNEAMVSGMDPKGIKDPEVRKAYEDAIAQNHRRAEKLNREMAISRGVDNALIDIWVFVKIGFPENSASRREAIEIVQKTIPDRILLDRFNSGTMPGITW